MKKIFFLIFLMSTFLCVFSDDAPEGRVLSSVRYVFPLKLPGEIIEFKKVLLPSGEIEVISSSSLYNTLTAVRTLEYEEEQLAILRYGALRGELRGV